MRSISERLWNVSRLLRRYNASTSCYVQILCLHVAADGRGLGEGRHFMTGRMRIPISGLACFRSERPLTRNVSPNTQGLLSSSSVQVA